MLNLRFVFRALLLAIPLALLLAALGLLAIYWRTNSPLGPIPPLPAILAPRGEMPADNVGLQEWAKYQGGEYGLTGCGFILRLENGTSVGVTTAHSLEIGNPARPLVNVAFGVAGMEGFVLTADAFWGPPGEPRTGDDFTVDYVFLKVDARVDPALILTPDSRGTAQSGERVTLFSGLGDENGGRRMFEGTVYSVSATAVWVVMDEFFDPSRVSGSPFVSQHTGQVVGMVIAASPRGKRFTMGMHPIGSIVAKAEAAREFPKIVELGR